MAGEQAALDQLIAQAEDLDRQLQVPDGQREDLVAMRRSRNLPISHDG